MGFKFKDLNKIVPDAYHGTNYANAKEILEGGAFLPSKGENEYLGFGIYFFEGSEWEAKQWARHKYGRAKVGVMWATINLGRCLDLSIKEHRDLIKETVAVLSKRPNMPRITDALVINLIAGKYKELIDTVRAIYIPNQGHIPQPLFQGSLFYDATRMMICVRNAKAILRFSISYEGIV